MNLLIRFKTIVAVFTLVGWPGIVGAQSFPRIKPLPPKKDPTILKAAAPLATNSPWQLLTTKVTSKPSLSSPPFWEMRRR